MARKDGIIALEDVQLGTYAVGAIYEPGSLYIGEGVYEDPAKATEAGVKAKTLQPHTRFVLLQVVAEFKAEVTTSVESLQDTPEDEIPRETG